jgi:peptide/nickel transport system substrate-binding protein
MGWRSATAVLLAVTVLGMGCAAPASNGPPSSAAAPSGGVPKTKRIVAGMTGEPTGFVARMTTTQNSIPGANDLEQLVNASLSEETGDHRLQPQLAEAVPTLENGLWVLLPDGRMETSWRIREGAQWHDGTPLTSDDFVFTAAVDQNKDLAIVRPTGYSWVQDVEAVDPRTVRVTWSQPYIGADTMFAPGFASPLPKHLLKDAFDTDVVHILTHPYWVQEYVGTGPYSVRQWTPGASIQLQANNTYVLGRPRVDEIEIRFIGDLNTLVANLISGAVDLSLGRGFTVESALELRNQWPEGKMDLEFSGYINIMPQFLNPRPAIVTDANFRRALLYGTNRQELVDSLQGGLGNVADVHIGPAYPEYADVQDSIVRYPYDPRQAAQLFESLGYRRGADGTYRDGSGERLAVELRSNGSPITEKTIVAVADLWTRLGVATEPNRVPQPQMVDREYVATFPAFRMTRQNGTPDFITRIHSKQIPLPENRFVGPNYARYRNSEFDALLDQYSVTIPKNDRIQVLRRIANFVTDNAIIMGVFYDANITYMNGRLINVGARDSNVWDVHLWDSSS